jgi:hypothetical protein
MRTIVTICSKNKDGSTGDIAAYLRYKSNRINEVMKVATKKKLPFFILSGKYGLIKHDQPIPFYNHLLVNEETDRLAKIISDQIINYGINSITFYAKPKLQDWAAYYDALEKAASMAKINLDIHTLKVN